MGWLDSIGSGLNKVLGGVSSAKMSHQNQKEIMELEHKYNKEYAQNAHQWEVQDLKKAGLNPAIASNGSTGASIAGSSVGASPGASSANGNIGDLISAGSNIASIISQIRTNEKLNAKTEAETNEIIARTPYIPEQKKAEIANLNADNLLKEEQREQIRTGKLGQTFGTDNAKLINQVVYDIAGLKGKSAKKIANELRSIVFKGGKKGKEMFENVIDSGLFDLGTWGK